MAANPFQYAVSAVKKKATELFNQSPYVQGAQMYGKMAQSKPVQNFVQQATRQVQQAPRVAQNYLARQTITPPQINVPLQTFGIKPPNLGQAGKFLLNNPIAPVYKVDTKQILPNNLLQSFPKDKDYFNPKTTNRERMNMTQPLMDRTMVGLSLYGPNKVKGTPLPLKKPLGESGGVVKQGSQKLPKQLPKEAGVNKFKQDYPDSTNNPLYEDMRKAQRNMMDKVEQIKPKYKNDSEIPKSIKAELDNFKRVWQEKAKQWEDVYVNQPKPSLPKELEGLAETPKTVRVWKNSRFGNGGGYDDIPVIRKEEGITLYQGGKAGDNRQFWTPDRKYAEQFGNVKEKTGTFYQVDNGNRVTHVYVEAPNQSKGVQNADLSFKLPVYPQLKVVNGKLKVKMKPIEGAKLTMPQTQIEAQSPNQISEVSSQLPPSSGASNKSITQNLNPQDPYFNVEKLNVSKDVKRSVAKVIMESKPQIEKVVGKKLSNKEVIDVANNSAQTIRKAITRKETIAWESKMLRARQQLASQAESGTVTKEYLDNLIAIKSQGTDIARKLQSLSIGANPSEITAKQAILEAVLKATNNADDVLRKAKGVDFNDIKQATKFYREFIKPTKEDWVTLLRYNSMLSSPNTHIVNTASNFQGTGLIAPVEKTLLGGVDFLNSAVTGKPRQYFAGEGPAYARGYYSKIGEASHKFADVMRGKSLMQNPDMREIPLTVGGKGRMVENTLSYPLRMLEGADQFFQTLSKGGVERSLKYRASKGVNVTNIQAKAQQEAASRLFRGELSPQEQGTVLNAIDEVTKGIFSLRNNNNRIVRNIAKFTLPFVKTPMNILKQGVEYSPMGFSTMYKAQAPIEQFTKALMGTGIGIGSAILVGSDRLSWAEPTSAKKRDAYRAAGLQPYSIKIGDNWVSYSKLHPAIAFNFAMVAAIRDAQKNEKLSDSETDTVLKGLAKFWGFFADQSYLKNIGDFVASSKGDLEGTARYISNYPQQLIPFRALMGWVTRLVDPYQRRVDPDGKILNKQLQQIMTQIPGLSGQIPARVDTEGEPVKQQNPYINAFSPNRVTTENPQKKVIYDEMEAKTKQTRRDTEIKAELKKTGNVVRLDDKNVYVVQPNGDTRKIDLTFTPKMPTFTGDVEADKKLRQKAYTGIGRKSKDIIQLQEQGAIDPQEAETKLQELQVLRDNVKASAPNVTKVKAAYTKVRSARVKAPKGKKPKKLKIPKLKAIKVKYTKLKVKIPKPKKFKSLLAKPKKNKYFV